MTILQPPTDITADQLSGFAIGKKIRFEAGPPQRRTVYVDVLTSVEHRQVRINGSTLPAKYRTETTIRIANTTWSNSGILGLGAQSDVGLTIPADTRIEIQR